MITTKQFLRMTRQHYFFGDIGDGTRKGVHGWKWNGTWVDSGTYTVDIQKADEGLLENQKMLVQFKPDTNETEYLFFLVDEKEEKRLDITSRVLSGEYTFYMSWAVAN